MGSATAGAGLSAIGPGGVAGERPAPPCFCGNPASCRQTQSKESANYGRWWYACYKDVRDPKKCKFFEWADEPPREKYRTHYLNHRYDIDLYANYPRRPWPNPEAKSPRSAAAASAAPP